MRVLLIDNYDSYTFNLAQLMAQTYGRMPMVLRNDSPVLRRVDPADFDAIVVSPGPGRPGEPRDLGHTIGVMCATGLPVLGVCLGHQAIGWHAGAPIGPAPQPRHGFIDRIRHQGTDLFAGLPQDFPATRYHSLCVDPVAVSAVEPTAWGTDGVVMGLRHRDRPWWGVQFHPESIGTRHGAQLLENFARLAHAARPALASRSAGAARPALMVGSTSSPGASSPGAPSRVLFSGVRQPAHPWRLRFQRLAGEVPLESVYRRWFADSRASFWLDSSLIEPGLSRFSFAGDAGGPHGETLTYRVGSERVRVTRSDGSVAYQPGSVYDVLGARIAARTLAEEPGLPFDLDGGYVGFLGYEMKAEPGGVAVHRSEASDVAARQLAAAARQGVTQQGVIRRADTPDAVWLSATRFVAVDHIEKRTYVVALAGPDPTDVVTADRWVTEIADALRAGECPADDRPALPLINGGLSTGFSRPIFPVDRPTSSKRPAELTVDRPTSTEKRAGLPVDRPTSTEGESGADAERWDVERWDAERWDAERWLDRSRARYLADIAECQRLLCAGESYEICLTNQLRMPYPGDPFAFYQRQRLLNPAPYAAFLAWDGFQIACSSPERFLRITRDRLVESKPIKGTAPRHADPKLDRIVRAELAADPKSRAENMMIVDLIRNDLGRVCAVGTVTVPHLMTVESYATVHQMVSTVRGRLRDDVDALTATRACFPGGSMTGAPKLRTMEILDRLEQSPRGVYSGALGYFALNGAADLNIVIRTAVFANGQLTVGAGGAIVLDSDPVAEFEEMLLKLRAPLRPLLAYPTDTPVPMV